MDTDSSLPKMCIRDRYKLARKYLGGGTAVGEEAVEQAKQRKDSRLSVMRPVREGEDVYKRQTLTIGCYGRFVPEDSIRRRDDDEIIAAEPFNEPAE